MQSVCAIRKRQSMIHCIRPWIRTQNVARQGVMCTAEPHVWVTDAILHCVQMLIPEKCWRDWIWSDATESTCTYERWITTLYKHGGCYEYGQVFAGEFIAIWHHNTIFILIQYNSRVANIRKMKSFFQIRNHLSSSPLHNQRLCKRQF